MPTAQLKSLFSRPADLFFTVYCIIHIPITLFIATQNIFLVKHLFVEIRLNPAAEYFPLALRDALAGFAKNSGDPWLSTIVAKKPLPAWWLAFIWCELLIQLPFFLYFPIAAISRTPSIRIRPSCTASMRQPRLRRFCLRCQSCIPSNQSRAVLQSSRFICPLSRDSPSSCGSDDCVLDRTRCC
ncbi:hypothetical protein BC829DRAFT_432699 [Chytridium lagenaria]|nr:hypothetical protein BC829DRAFT_432699 [Chytridium lagenaria]